MYTERTPEQQKTRRNRFIALAVFVCALLVALGILLNMIFASAKDQGAASIRSTILDAAMQCAAIEGSFPTNLAYLEDNYDLRVNHDDYVIIYEVLASNTVPSVVVLLCRIFPACQGMRARLPSMSWMRTRILFSPLLLSARTKALFPLRRTSSSQWFYSDCS